MTLAEKMVRWHVCRTEADKIEGEIKTEVLELKKTQKVGNVIASFNIGRGNYDYEKIASIIEADWRLIEKHTKTSVTTDWRKVVEEDGKATEEIKKQLYTEGTPYVKLKIEVGDKNANS